MIFRSKAPLRIGLAGGGTDVSPYCDQFGGAILNATISLSAHASIEIVEGEKITLKSIDQDEEFVFDKKEKPGNDSPFILAKGVYNYVVKNYGPVPSAFVLTTFVDAPAGSGLGTSSALVVAILGAFAEWLNLPMGEYDMARIAYEIEREDLKMAGGKQDQYAATFGGVNFMEFYGDRKVIVNPLRIRSEFLNELEHNLLLYFTSKSRRSADIIEKQAQNVLDKKTTSIEAMHQLKEQALMMKEALLRGQIDEIGRIFDFGFQQKKQMAQGISNATLDEVYELALKAGATGGKISGAGGGGFMIFYCPNQTKHAVKAALSHLPGVFKDYQFVKNGQLSWRV